LMNSFTSLVVYFPTVLFILLISIRSLYDILWSYWLSGLIFISACPLQHDRERAKEGMLLPGKTESFFENRLRNTWE
jgi:hypothetical protein